MAVNAPARDDTGARGSEPASGKTRDHSPTAAGNGSIAPLAINSTPVKTASTEHGLQHRLPCLRGIDPGRMWLIGRDNRASNHHAATSRHRACSRAGKSTRSRCHRSSERAHCDGT